MFQSKPLALTCHLCSREFGLSSLPVHIPQCEKKWLANEQVLPIQLQRTSAPSVPTSPIPTRKNRAEIENYNLEANEIYRRSSLVQCLGCYRSFNPEAFNTHLRSCADGNSILQSMPKKRVSPSKYSTSKIHSTSLNTSLNHTPVDDRNQQETEQDKAPCSYCLRQFSTDRLDKHMKSCTARPRGENGGRSMTPNKASLTKSLPSKSPESGKPHALVCFLCGREFGTTSLAIHIPTCEKKRAATIDKLPLKVIHPSPPSVPIPEKGPNFKERIDEYNREAYQIYEKCSRFPCNSCGRKFNAEALVVHMKSCGGSNPSSHPIPKSPPQRPRMLTCCICGQGFGSLSLPIHQKTCMAKHGWTSEQLDKAQCQDVIKPLDKMTDAELDSFNSTAFESYSSNTLVGCPNCFRTFLPDRLEVHLRSCKPGGSSKPIGKAQLSRSMDFLPGSSSQRASS